ncbi:FKBP-type peptidyl-prolyl cis-trans isomerase [Aeromicrobium sp.]|nr:FKBP-type peptidyl-prolyl cis-trans isomerase [Candidatus Saccharibacteria bacterium]
MLKNKYVFWSFIGFWVALLIGVVVWFFVLRSDSSDNRQTGSGQHIEATDSQSNTNQPITLSSPVAGGGPQLSANPNTGSSLSGTGPTTSNSSDIAKLLDPTAFAQYDKYKTAQSSSFIDLQVGSGAAVTGNSQVAVVYKGWLTNGTKFDESKAGADGKLQAFAFTEGQHQVISGWEAGLEGAKEGGVRLLIIPPALGYGAAGQGPIPGNSVLIFQVQIVQVK